MQDLIFWGSDYSAFLIEARERSPELVGQDENGYFTKYTKTPMKTNQDGEFMLLVRASDDQVGYFARLSTINNLGAYVAVLNAQPHRAIYDRIYDQSPREIINEDGSTSTYTPPEKFGEFYEKRVR